MIKSKILFFLTDLIEKTSLNSSFKFVNKSQKFSKEEIEKFQTEKLRKLIHYCYENVPYYTKLFDSLSLKPADIQKITDLEKLPKLTREIIINHREELISKNFKKFNPQARKTGGTTGVPLSYLSDFESWSMLWAVKLRAWSWADYHLGDKVAILAGASLIPGKNAPITKKVWNKLNNFYPFSMVHVNDEILEGYAKLIQKENITILRGYPSSIAVLAEFVERKGINLSIRAVITTAEVLRADYRIQIEKGFKCQVFDNYGCADGSGNASECEAHMGLHWAFETSILELVDESLNPVQAGTEGELLLTSLTNYAMPTIRYAPGDLATLSTQKCTCGRELPLLSQINGRTTDILKFSNGISIGGPALTLVFRDYPLRKYQVVQNSLDALDINLVPAENFDNQIHLESLKETIAFHCGKEIRLTFNFMDSIPLPTSGKFRFIINNTKKGK